MKRITEFIIRYKWLVIAFWVLIAGGVYLTAPSLSDVAKNDQASFLPGNSEAAMADKLVRELFPNKGGRSSVVFAIKRSSGITDSDREYAKRLEEYINVNKERLQVTEVLSPFTKKEFEKEMISKDSAAALIIANLRTPAYTDKTEEAVAGLRNDIKGEAALKGKGELIPPEGLEVYVTGDAAMGQEEHESVNKSLELTVKITIFLVAFILIIIYRSPIAPLLPLATIGLSYVVSRGVIAAFTTMGLKVSAFTDQFLVAVLFGAGTDYCLLIISRYKEELSQGKSLKEALLDTMPNTAEAIISSGGTVIIGFLFMIFAKFGLFNTTGPSIAVGVAITILAVLTLIPAFIAVLGEKIFWPAHPSAGKKVVKSKTPFWEKVAAAVAAKPVRFIIISLLVFTPFLVSTHWLTQSYDQLSELPSSTDSVKGFNVMKKYFDQGAMLPMKVVMKWNGDAWTNESLQMIDKIADNISRVDGVAEVRAATRPIGEKITETTLSKQINMLSEGLGKIQEGFDPVATGLGEMQNGMNQIASGISKGSGELGKLAKATEQTGDGLGQTRSGLDRLSSGTAASVSGLKQISDSLDTLAAAVGSTKTGLEGIYGALDGSVKQLEAILKSSPELAANMEFQKAYGTIKAVTANLNKLSGGLDQVKGGIASTAGGVKNTGKGLEDINGGIKKSNSALGQMEQGLDTMAKGQVKASEDLKTASESLLKIASGINPGKDALNKMKSGISDVRDMAEEYSGKKGMQADQFFLPPGVLEEYPELKTAMENYISPDGKGITLDVVLKTSPYSRSALDKVNDIKETIVFTLRGTAAANNEFRIGGATSVLSEIREITSQDFAKVMFFVLLGIFIVLMLLLRSVIAPIYLILTILISYATTMGITSLVFQKIMGYDGINWAVPFFAFCVLVALGVDYNIFLMSRVKEEYKPGDMKGAVVRGLASTGGIITSCGIIMAGTFGAMMFSPIRPMLEVGFAATVGLLLDTFIVRCLLVPAIAVKVGELNWWPGRKVRVVSGELEKD